MEDQRGRVVVGVDGSAGSRAALVHALEDAARRGAAVEVVTAFEHPEYWAPHYVPPVITIEELREDVRRDIETVVQEITGEFADRVEALPPVTVHPVPGGAAHALLRAAEGADLLVVGSRGRGGFAGVLLGSVGLLCVLHAPCPVTVVHEVRPEQHTASAVADAAPAVS
jgi:nucleotide-binding universal stress UspA family protein